MIDNTARDLLALSCIAFQQKDYKNAASLFSCAMSIEDSRELIDSLIEGNYTGEVLAESLANSNTDSDISSISNAMADVMNGIDVRRKRRELRSDEEDSLEFDADSLDVDEELETSSSTVRKEVKSPIRISFK